MKKLNIFAIVLFVTFLGLFIFDKVRDQEPETELAPLQKREEPIKAVKIFKLKETKVEPMVSNITPETHYEESIPEPTKKLKEGEFPMHKGRHVAMYRAGKLIVPDKGSTKKLIFSKNPVHPDIEKRAMQFFNAMGFEKPVLERGKPYFLVNGDNALKVDEFKVSYNWNGKAKKGTYLIRSATGRYYRKLADTQ